MPLIAGSIAPTPAPFAAQTIRADLKEQSMTTFKNFRNRGQQPRSDETGPPSAMSSRTSDGQLPRPGMPPSTATELGPQHMEILRQIEAEGEPLSLAEELAELADRGELDEAAPRRSTSSTSRAKRTSPSCSG